MRLGLSASIRRKGKSQTKLKTDRSPSWGRGRKMQSISVCAPGCLSLPLIPREGGRRASLSACLCVCLSVSPAHSPGKEDAEHLCLPVCASACLSLPLTPQGRQMQSVFVCLFVSVCLSACLSLPTSPIKG